MSRACLFIIIWLLLLAAPAYPAEAEPPPPPVRIGVLAILGPEAAQKEWGPLLGWLEKKLPNWDFELVPADFEDLRRLLYAGTLDFVITNPGNYVELEDAYGISRILTQAPQDGDSSYATGGTIVTLKDSPIYSLEDLRARRLAVVSTSAFGGFQVIWHELDKIGLNPWTDTHLVVKGFPMTNVLDAMENDEADMALMRTCVLEGVPDWEKKFRVLNVKDQSDLLCATSSALYPGWAVAITPGTRRDLARQVTVALMQMPPQPGTVGMVYWTVPGNYQRVHDVFRDLKTGPYTYLNDLTPLGLVKRYWPWVAVFLLIGMGGLAYTLRVDRLVHVRTSELRTALNEQKEMQVRINTAQEQADHMARLSILGEMSGTLAHELNQPLAAIGNYSRSLIRRAEAGRLNPNDIQRAASEISGQTDRAGAIVQGIRSFARKRPASLELLDPLSVLREPMALFQGMLSYSPAIELKNLIRQEAQIYVDALQMQQVLLNLLKNAADAMDTLPLQERRITVTLWLGDGYARFSVRDCGKGLDPAAMEHLFSPFYTTKESGLGLGLAICRSIAEGHGGNLRVDLVEPGIDPGSPPQGGAVFTLSIPLCAEPAGEA